MSRVSVSAVAVGLLTAALLSPQASAQQPSGSSTGSTVESDFYTPPSPLPALAPGALIRTEPSHLALSVPGIGGTLPGEATRIMYR
ncbi:MAG: lipase, partial [Rhodococcus sp. (in: high G+C Gram-positive bacteria)]